MIGKLLCVCVRECASVRLCFVSILLFHTHIRCGFFSVGIQQPDAEWSAMNSCVGVCTIGRCLVPGSFQSNTPKQEDNILCTFSHRLKYISLPFIVGPKKISSSLTYDSAAICITLLASHCRRTFVFGLCSAQLHSYDSSPLIRSSFFCTSPDTFLSKIVKCKIRQTAKHRRRFLWLAVFSNSLSFFLSALGKLAEFFIALFSLHY